MSAPSNTTPGLFGINKSNRDFSNRESWGKNQFNSAFPTALACYMHKSNLSPVYLKLGANSKLQHDKISVTDLFGIDPTSDELYFAFERDYAPYQEMVIGTLPRIDLVTMKGGETRRGIEIKLTALPDNSTFALSDDEYGSELVIRPDTIVYLALGIAKTCPLGELKAAFSQLKPITDWTDEREMLRTLPDFLKCLELIFSHIQESQEPLVMQPVWKTSGKLPQLAPNCLDIFVWSNLGFTRLFIDATKNKSEGQASSIDRQMRTTLWLVKMLFDYSNTLQINHLQVIDKMTYNTKNDKAFAVNGQITNPYMTSTELKNPRIKDSEMKKIILNGGHKLLSPERRFDAIIFYSPNLFEE